MPLNQKPAVAQGVGLALLLLSMAPEKSDDLQNPLRKSALFGDVPDKSSDLPYLTFAYSYFQGPNVEASFHDDDDEEEEDDASHCESTNTDGEGRSSTSSLITTARIMSKAMVPYTPPQCFADDAVLNCLASYCNLHDLVALRRVNKRALAVVEKYAKFDSNLLAVFVPVPQRILDCKSVCNEEHPDWECRLCHNPNRFTSLRCSTPNCNSTRPYCSTNTPSSNGQVSTRIFCGQLRKDSTVSCILWVMSMTMNERFEVGRVEAHTNAHDNRGKGCAWVHLYDTRVISTFLTLDHRVFFDYDEETDQEGVWICANTPAAKEALAQYSQQGSRNRPVVLPRGPLVVELPHAPQRRSETRTQRFPRAAPTPARPTSRHSDAASGGLTQSQPYRSPETCHAQHPSSQPYEAPQTHAYMMTHRHQPPSYHYNSYAPSHANHTCAHGGTYVQYAAPTQQPYTHYAACRHAYLAPTQSFVPQHQYQPYPHQHNPYVVVQHTPYTSAPMHTAYAPSLEHHAGCTCPQCMPCI